jgi:hypothetical protein
MAALAEPISIFERLLCDQAIRLRLQLDALGVKLRAATEGNGVWTDHDIRTFNSIGNQYRLVLRELRLQPKGRSRPRASLAELLTEVGSESVSAGSKAKKPH